MKYIELLNIVKKQEINVIKLETEQRYRTKGGKSSLLFKLY